MRREFIIVLLGIILTSTLSSMLSGIVPTSTDKVLLDTVVGSVGAGNFSYWQLGHTGHLIVELTSLTGDADLYVSDSISLRPSFEIDKNNLSSTTCGLDVVDIPRDFPRPIGIGVFGHWSHSLSEYSIQVYTKYEQLTEELNQFLAEQQMDFDNVQRDSVPAKDTKTPSQQTTTKPEKEPPRVLKFFRLLGTMFEVFDVFTF